jgi:hypothetical protein
VTLEEAIYFPRMSLSMLSILSKSMAGRYITITSKASVKNRKSILSFSGYVRRFHFLAAANASDVPIATSASAIT